MPGPASAPAGYRHDRGLDDRRSPTHHGKCQERERCTGPGCRVRTGKTDTAKRGVMRQAQHDELERIRAKENAA